MSECSRTVLVDNMAAVTLDLMRDDRFSMSWLRTGIKNTLRNINKPSPGIWRRLSCRLPPIRKALYYAAVVIMFSPDAAVPPSLATRNPRRRQRTGSDDSVALRHNPKRIRRSGLTSDTFQPPPSTKPNGHIAHVAEETLTNGHAKEPANLRHASVDTTSLAIRHRGVKKADRERRTSKDDGSIELASYQIVGALQGADID